MKVKLKEIGKIITGNTPSKQNALYYNSNDILFVKPDILQLKSVCNINDSKEFISENARAVSRIVPKGSLLVTCIGIVGKIGIVDIDECAFNQQINAIVPNYNIKSKYLAYVLFYNRGRLNDIANAPVVPIINKSEFENFEVNIIDDIKKQENIIQILDKIENIIYKYECILKALDTLIKARFVEMFGSGIKVNIKCLKDICKSIVDGSHNPSKGVNYETEYLMLSSKNVINNILTYDEPRYLTQDEFNLENQRTNVEFNDVLLTIVGTVGRSAVVKDNSNITFQRSVAVLKPKSSEINSLYLKYYLDVNNEIVVNNAHGIAQIGIYLDQVRNLQIDIPSLDLQYTFATFVKEVDKLKFDVQKSLEKIQMLFDSLMQEFFG